MKNAVAHRHSLHSLHCIQTPHYIYDTVEREKKKTKKNIEKSGVTARVVEKKKISKTGDASVYMYVYVYV